MLGILGDQEIVNSLIAKDGFEASIKACKGHNWDKIGDKICIFPFVEDNLGPFSYDLCIGDEVIYQRKGNEPVKLKKGDRINIDPGASVIVLTLEYIILSKYFGGLIQPKARHLMEGVILCSAKVDPTWYGKLGIVLTDTQNEIMSFSYGEPFCTMLLFKLNKPVSKILTKKDVPFLGQENLEIKPIHARRWKPKKEETIIKDDIDNVVDLYGPPFDIVRGMFKFHENKIYDYLDKDWGTGAIRTIKYSLWQDEIKYLRDANTKFSVTLILSVLGWIGVVIVLILKLLGKV